MGLRTTGCAIFSPAAHRELAQRGFGTLRHRMLKPRPSGLQRDVPSGFSVRRQGYAPQPDAPFTSKVPPIALRFASLACRECRGNRAMAMFKLLARSAPASLIA